MRTENSSIVLIDDQELFRAGVRLLLAKEPGLEIVGEAGSAAEALPLVKREQPDVILLGIDTQDSIGLNLLPELSVASETSRVLVLSGSNDPEVQRRAIHSGAIGVLSKKQPPNILVKAIERVRAGEAWIDRATTASVLRALSQANRAKKPDPEEVKIATLTAREREVIKLIGLGLKSRQIAEQLFISEITVHHHLTSVYSKLEVADRFDLLIYAYKNGLAELPR